MKAFIFIYNGGASEREEFVEILDNVPEVYTWRYDMVSCFYILSDHTAQQISAAIEKKSQKTERHIVTQLGEEYWGRLTGESWHFLQKLEHKPESNN
jgi:hypothetical protein